MVARLAWTHADADRHRQLRQALVTSFLVVLTSMTLNEILKIGSFSVIFCDFQLQRTLQEWIATKWMEVKQDILRAGTAKAVAHLMSFAQITC